MIKQIVLDTTYVRTYMRVTSAWMDNKAAALYVALKCRFKHYVQLAADTH